MELLDLMKKRSSLRNFLKKPVDEAVITQILEAGRIAPSACNLQPWHVIVITGEVAREELKSAVKPWVAEAPVVLVVCVDHSTGWRRRDGKDHCDVDCAIAVDHMTLMATSLGLGTCWVCSFDSGELARLMHLPAGWEAVVVLPLGYPEPGKEVSPDRHAKERKQLSQITSHTVFGRRREC